MVEEIKKMKFRELFETEQFYLHNERANAMSLFEAFCDMEVTYRNNEKLVYKIKQGNYNLIQKLKGIMLKNGDMLIHPEYVDYYLCLRVNKN